MMFSLMISIDRAETYVLDGQQSVKIGNEYSSKLLWLSVGSTSVKDVKDRYSRLNARRTRLFHAEYGEWRDTLLPWGTSHHLQPHYRFPADV